MTYFRSATCPLCRNSYLIDPVHGDLGCPTRCEQKRGSPVTGRRTLRITTELLLQILQGFRDGPPRYFRVTRDALPVDVRVVSCRPQFGAWEVVLESDQWQSAEPDVCPLCEVVEVTEPRRGGAGGG